MNKQVFRHLLLAFAVLEWACDLVGDLCDVMAEMAEDSNRRPYLFCPHFYYSFLRDAIWGINYDERPS